MELVLGRFLLTLSIGLPIVLGVATAGSFLAIKGALAPVKKITLNAESITEIPELKDDLNRAEATLRESQQAVIKVQADYRDADLEYQRLAEVAKQHANLVAQQQLDNAAAKDEAERGSLGMAQEHVAECRAEVGRINSLLAYSKITVPFNGVITNRYADLRSLVQAGTASDTQTKPLVELSEDDLLRLRFPVPEQQTPLIHDGKTV